MTTAIPWAKTGFLSRTLGATLMLGLCLLFKAPLQAQTQPRSTFDTLNVNLLPLEDKVLGSPTRAALYAAAVPGMGQVYNRKYWKVPLAYGGFVVFASLVDFFNVRFEQFRDALVLNAEGRQDEILIPRLQRLSADQLRRGRDNFRRNRDFNIVLTIGWYGLTIADAVVDAHLAEFTISDDLAMKLSPGLIPNDMNTIAAGVKLTIYLKR